MTRPKKAAASAAIEVLASAERRSAMGALAEDKMEEPYKVSRQAVVIIHGIGEQRPMSTLRSFTDALLRLEPDGAKGVIWSKPDDVSEGFEHRRLTLPGTRSRPLTDVYELYWAHLFEQTNPSTFWDWASRIALRPIPALSLRFRRIAIVAWVVVAVAFVGVYAAWQYFAGTELLKGLIALPFVVVGYSVLMYHVNRFFLGTISDAARYLDANPRNVAARNAVRRLGVDFLDKLHKHVRCYDRIIICGHSLGSVIGYDILQHLWYRYHETHARVPEVRQAAFKLMSRAALAKDGPAAQSHQRRLWIEQASLGNRWRISDFVTLGSPLTYADVLMAESAHDFETLLQMGELSSCPPRADPVTKKIGFKRKYEAKMVGFRTIYLLTHSSLFAVTRWSNIYFKNRFRIFGDPIAGPVGPLFGAGVHDQEVSTGDRFRLFTHGHYWSSDGYDAGADDAPLSALKRALQLDLKQIVPDEAQSS